MNKLTTSIIGLALTLGLSHAYATTPINFVCPEPQEIQSTDFTAPSIWVAPPVVHSVPGTAGVGLGGKTAVKLLGVERVDINHRPGWVCVYESKGGTSANDYQSKIREIVSENKFLRKYFHKINDFIEHTEPFLANYPKDKPIGFIGYQLTAQEFDGSED